MASAKKAVKKTAKKIADPAGGKGPAELLLAAIQSNDGLPAARLAEIAGLARSTATRTLAQMEKDGLVERVKGGHDGTKRTPDTWTLPAPKTRSGGKKAEKKTAKAAKSAPAAGSATGRLKKGELADMVQRHLAENPREEYGPSQLAKILDRSAGAIANALDKLEADGTVVRTAEGPRRNRIAKKTKKKK